MYVCVCNTCVSGVYRAQRGLQTLWSWSYRGQQAAMGCCELNPVLCKNKSDWSGEAETLHCTAEKDLGTRQEDADWASLRRDFEGLVCDGHLSSQHLEGKGG